MEVVKDLYLSFVFRCLRCGFGCQFCIFIAKSLFRGNWLFMVSVPWACKLGSVLTGPGVSVGTTLWTFVFLGDITSNWMWFQWNTRHYYSPMCVHLRSIWVMLRVPLSTHAFFDRAGSVARNNIVNIRISVWYHLDLDVVSMEYATLLLANVCTLAFALSNVTRLKWIHGILWTGSFTA